MSVLTEDTDSMLKRLNAAGLQANIWKATVSIEPLPLPLPPEFSPPLAPTVFCKPSPVTTKPDGSTGTPEDSPPLVTSFMADIFTGA